MRSGTNRSGSNLSGRAGTGAGGRLHVLPPRAPAPAEEESWSSRHLLGFLILFLAVAMLPPDRLFWDGIGFLEWARNDPIRLDFGHLVYMPLLRGFHELVNLVWTASWEQSGKLVSALGGAAFFVWLWRMLERRGLATELALTLSLLVATAPMVWDQGGTVEPTTWTLAFLIVSAEAASAYGAERTLRKAIGLALAFALLLGFHVASVCALPWILFLARGPAPRPPLHHVLIPLSAIVLATTLLLATGESAAQESFGAYWSAFLPDLGLSTLAEHLDYAWRFVWFGMPGIAVAACLGVGLGLFGPRRGWRALDAGALVLGIPYLTAFLLLGLPKIALLIPLTITGALLAGAGLGAHAPVLLARRCTNVLLALALSFQLGFGMVKALEISRNPDELQRTAEMMANALPKDAVLFSGFAAHHVRWFTGVPVVALPNEMHADVPGGEVRPIEILRRLIVRERQRHAATYISSEAVEWLEWRYGTKPEWVPVNRHAFIQVADDPPLYLAPLILPEEETFPGGE